MNRRAISTPLRPALRILGFALLCACSKEDGAPTRSSGRPNILIVSMDTTRADALGCYGSERGATPNLDALALDSVVFDQAVSPAPLTLPSHSTLLTGLDPPRHRVRENSLFVLSENAQTLAEALGENGYSSFAAVGTVILLPSFGLSQGFDEYDAGSIEVTTERMRAERPADEVVDSALDSWSRMQEPWFGFVHLYDPHQPFTAPRKYAEKYRGEPLDQYFAEIAHADAEIGRFLDRLRQAGQLERTLIVFTADHGEGRKEHGEITHGSMVYDSTQRIPLLFAHPDLPAHRVPAQVALADVMPTVLDFCGVLSEQALDGRSLLAALRDPERTLEPKDAWVESHSSALSFDWSTLEGVRTANWKFVQGARPHLFDLALDPKEERDVADQHPEKVTEFQTRLERLRARGPSLDRSTRLLSPLELQALGGIGYVPAVSEEAAPDSRLRPDPMDHVADAERLELCLSQIQVQRFAAALPDLEKLAVEFPGTFQIQQALGNCYGRLGRAAEALTVLRRAEQIHDHLPDLHSSIAIACFQVEDFDAAEKALEKAISLPGCTGKPYLMLDQLYRERLGRSDDARRVLEAMLQSVSVSPEEKAQARRLLGH